MSQQYPGGLITKNPVVPSGPYENSSASGVWTMDQAAQYIKAGNWPTAGNVDPSAFIENLFSTYLYTGNDATQSASTGISLSTNGGLVWTKRRNGAASHFLIDTVRGNNKPLNSNSTAAQTVAGVDYITPTTTGYTIQNVGNINTTGETYASWTFRKQAKFFDVVTWTGDGSNPRTISHNLGATPGCIIAKKTSATGNWFVYHRGLSNSDLNNIYLNGTNGATNLDSPGWGVTSTGFTARAAASLNDNGATYVAYLFAHDAGGFGLSGTDNVISCGSFTTDGSGNATVTLGYEPQWILYKISSAASNWFILDNMRGLAVNTSGGANGPHLLPNLSNAETPSGNSLSPTATGFQANGITPSATYIYIAIRRGPMKVPTSGTSVYQPVARTGTGANATITSDFVTDLSISQIRSGSAQGAPNGFFDRLRGATKHLSSNTTDAEITYSDSLTSFASNTGITVGADNSSGAINYGGTNYGQWFFRRAPGFFDVVCYTGTGVARTINHNLAAVPELMIVRRRSSIANWAVNSQSLTASDYLYLNSTDPKADNTSPIIWNSTRPTSTVFSVGTSNLTNENTQTFVAYLFATVAGVSKVGSYTGSGTTKQIDCGFTAGARFVLIKRTDSTGDWYVYDSARGIVAGNDPYLLLNSTAAEVASTDYVDTYSAGFELSSTAPAALNANGGTYIFLAIA